MFYLLGGGIPLLGLILASRWGILPLVSSKSTAVSSVPSSAKLSKHRYSFPEISSSSRQENTQTQRIHIIVLIHGWMGNSRELSVLQSSLPTTARPAGTRVVVHAVTCNEGRTGDGIAAGGRRCAQEIEALVQHVSQSFSSTEKENGNTMSLSIISNSLGGLYARYALGHLPQWKNVRPAVFVTICTPHLGVGTPHLPWGLGGASLPHWIQTGLALGLGPTGRDLFRIAPPAVWQQLHRPEYLQPLRRFRRRVAGANLHQTDLQVPGTTAAFLVLGGAPTPHTPWTSPIDDAQHRGSGIACMVETAQASSFFSDDSTSDVLVETPDRVASSNAMAAQLDQLGWVKIFCDMRPHLPDLLAWLGTSSKTESLVAEPAAEDLWRMCAELTHRTMLPVGHTMLVANAKNPFYARLNQAGRPTMEHLAQLLMHEICHKDD
jgi:pimeloyl-ACP methyl ester carboxylesterase